MKRKIWFVVLGIMMVVSLILSIALPITAAGSVFLTPITITDTSGSTRTNYPVIVPLNISSMQSTGMLSTSGLDSGVLVGTTAQKFMFTNTGILIVQNTLAAFQSNINNLYTNGYSPAQTSMPIIVGENGYLTTPYNASLELGTVFRIEVNGLLDMVNGGPIMTTGNLSGYLRLEVAAGNVIAQVGETGGEVDLSLSGVTAAAANDVVFSADGSIYTLAVDGNSTTATETTGVPYTGTDFIWDLSSTMPYINYIKMSTLQTVGTFVNPTAIYNDGSDVYLGAGGHILKTSPSLGLILTDYTVSIMGWSNPYIDSMTSDGTYLYVGVHSTNSAIALYEVLQLNKSDFSLHGTWSQTEGSLGTPNAGTGVSLANDATYVYISGNTGANDNATVWQITKSDMTLHQSWTDTSDYVFSGIVLVSGNLYVGEVNNVVKVETSGMTTVTTYNGGVYSFYGITYDGTYIVVISSSGTIQQIDTSSMTLHNSGTLPALPGGSYSDLTYDATTSDYYTWENNTNYLYQIDSSFNITGTWSIPSSYYIMGGISSLSGMLYFATSEPQVYKVDGTTMNTVAAGIYFSTTLPTEVLKYQPDTIIQGDVLPDLDSTQDGTFTFGTNSGITFTTGGSTSQTSYISGTGGNIGIPTPIPVPGNIPGYVEQTTEPTQMPEYDLFHQAAQALGWGTFTLYGLLEIFVAICLGMGVGVATGSTLLAALACFTGLLVGFGTGQLGLWIVICYGILAFTWTATAKSF